MSPLAEKHVPANAWYLSILGVSPSSQGQGLGVKLLLPTLAEADVANVPTYLETFSPRNIPFYARDWLRSCRRIPGASHALNVQHHVPRSQYPALGLPLRGKKLTGVLAVGDCLDHLLRKRRYRSSLKGCHSIRLPWTSRSTKTRKSTRSSSLPLRHPVAVNRKPHGAWFDWGGEVTFARCGAKRWGWCQPIHLQRLIVGEMEINTIIDFLVMVTSNWR